MPQETYSLASLGTNVDEDRSSQVQYAPLQNMMSAAHLVATLLIAHHHRTHPTATLDALEIEQDCCYGIQGGFSIQLRGGRQSTRDIDLVTSTKMKGVWEAVTGEERIILPDSRLVEGVLKIFVKTGSPWDACSEQHRVEVDIKQAGFRKSPRKLHGNLDRVGPFNFFGESVEFTVLNIPYMMRIKVECCLTRAEQRDFDDVRWMLINHLEAVQCAIGDGIVLEDELVEVLEDVRIGEKSQRTTLLRQLEARDSEKGDSP